MKPPISILIKIHKKYTDQSRTAPASISELPQQIILSNQYSQLLDLTISIMDLILWLIGYLDLSKYLMPPKKQNCCYTIKDCEAPLPNNLPKQDDFSIVQPFAYMQRGLSANYEFADFISVFESSPDKQSGDDKSRLTSINTADFKKAISKLVVDSFPAKFTPCQSDLKKLDTEQLILVAFDTEYWNVFSDSKVDSFKPAWEQCAKDRLLPVAEGFPQRKKDFFKFNVKIFFQVKKCKKDQGAPANPLTVKLLKILDDYKLCYKLIQGQSKSFCGVQNAIIAGRFNDGVQKPKDPYTFYLHCLLGYNQAKHLGGSYLLAQKCDFDWMSIHASSESLPGVIGRNDIKNGSSIFSQNHCPRSHIRLSRIKDDEGNPVTMHRESKSFTSAGFDPTQNRSVTDNINPQEGIFFIAYHKDTKMLQKALLSQLGNNSKTSYDDGLLNHFKVSYGNILYSPNIFELTGKKLDNPDINAEVASICEYHQTRWLKNYKRNEEDQENWKTTGNQYYLYSRAGYMRKMSYAHQYNKDLNAPSPRILRIVSRTFSLWQDTWYYDRKQKQVPHLQQLLYSNQLRKDLPDLTAGIKELQKLTGINFRTTDYKSLPMVIRNGLAVHFGLGHIVSTEAYGCRGPINGDPHNPFGANTFHLEPEDVLAGGEANLTFGQGKHIVEYLTKEQMQTNWLNGKNLSGQSGIGHVIPYIEEIMEKGLQYLIDQFKAKMLTFKTKNADKFNLFLGSYIALLGMQRYFINYSNLASKMIKTLKPVQVASLKSLTLIRETMLHLSTNAPIKPNPKNIQINNAAIHQRAQLVLSIFICLHLTGQPVSIGRLDYLLKAVGRPVTNADFEPTEFEQDVIDSFWIKVGEKANFNKGFFEDHQKWGNLAMGGNSNPYPQGASFNQWGHQLTVGGTILEGGKEVPFYNSITIACLRASRRIPVNAPCLGLRLHENSPRFVIEQGSKAILAGGAHPILLNDKKIISGLLRSGDYKIKNWDTKFKDAPELDNVPFEFWNPQIKPVDALDFGSDGCHEFLMVGKTWFWLGGGCVLQPLQYVINVGKSLSFAGPRYIHGKRQTYRWRELSTYTTYDQFEDQYFEIFEEVMSRGFAGQLSGFTDLTKYCPATLLNAFTADMRDRESDFYLNGATYKIFCPQFTGVANLANALWNIQTLVFDQKVTNLQQIRNALLVNWGDQLEEPFVPKTLPPIMKSRLKERCDMLREIGWRQAKFGIDKKATEFGLRLCNRMSIITRKIFEEPRENMLKLLKRLTKQLGSAQHPFGIQYTPGCGTFQNYADVGADYGASFDGRKKGQPLAEDLAPQNLLIDIGVNDPRFEWKDAFLSDIVDNYSYDVNDPQFFSGATLDLNINQDYNKDILTLNISQFAKGSGPNMLTISTGSRSLLEQARYNTDRDLLRFRMGGWTEFAVAMFPHLLEHHIRRKREVPKLLSIKPSKEELEEKEEKQLCAQGSTGKKKQKIE